MYGTSSCHAMQRLWFPLASSATYGGFTVGTTCQPPLPAEPSRDPPQASAAFIEAEILLAQGDDAAALTVMAPWHDAMRDFDYGLAILGFTLARNGRRDDASRIATDLEEQCRVGRAAWSGVALVHLGLGSTDNALGFLQRAARQKPFGGLMTA